jgi:DNA repair exonuclease SbcCD ATPase subunit
MKTRNDFAIEEEDQEYFDQQFELPELPSFDLLNAIKTEQQNRQEKLNRKSKVLKEDQSKLAVLKAKVGNMILSGAKESDLDAVYEEIDKQEVTLQRRENEYTTIAQAKETTKHTQAEVKQAFDQYKSEFERAAVLPEYEKLEKMKQDYLEAFHTLERQIIAFNERAKEVDSQLQRLQRLQGGVNYVSNELSVKYDNLDIRVPRHKEVW